MMTYITCDQRSILRTVGRDNNLASCPGLHWTENRELIGTEGLTKDADVTNFTF